MASTPTVIRVEDLHHTYLRGTPLETPSLRGVDFQVHMGEAVGLVGPTGSGKSTLLQLFRNTTKKNAVVLAPTGIAALNVKGQTIHSFFKFPAKPLNKEDITKRRNRKIYKKIEVLIIDEISMVRADLLDNIDYFLRLNRENSLPFGGVQVVFFGDLFQLPPVVSSDVEKQLFQSFYETPYFFQPKFLKMVSGRKISNCEKFIGKKIAIFLGYSKRFD